MRGAVAVIAAAMFLVTGSVQAPRPEAPVQAALLDSLFVRDSTRQLVVGDATVSGGSHYTDIDYGSALKMLGALHVKKVAQPRIS